MAGPRESSPAASSPGSTISDPNQDDQKLQMDLDGDDGPTTPPPKPTPRNAGSSRRSGIESTRGRKSRPGRKPKGLTPKKAGRIWIQEGPQDGTEDEGSVVSAYQKPGWSQKKSQSPRGSDAEVRQTVGTAIGTRRQANGTIGSVYSGNKIRHIKKEDGTPLWRKDIQHEFLRTVVEDTTPVFTRVSDGKEGLNFADIYIDAMARSSKTSKILKDRLQTDREAAQNMAMICLLVNVGRMNTTLNFFPEMRAQLRTYHSIPSLQAYKSQKDYKSLQDAPRLKSILKGASEDDPNEPRSLDALKERTIPRTNPVNLIFILSHYAPKISELHFTSSVDFFDLVIRHTISSKSRARAFLWLMWWYLESDFSKEAALNNPFGPGSYDPSKENEENDVPLKIPEFTFLTEEEGNAENVDPPFEAVFAEKMQKERKRLLLETGDDPENKLLKRIRKSGAFDNEDSLLSDGDSLVGRGSIAGKGSPSLLASDGKLGIVPNHPSGSVLGGQADSLDDEWEAVEPRPGRGRYKRPKNKNRRETRVSSSGRILLKSARAQAAADRETPDTAGVGTPQPQPPGAAHPVLNQYGGHGSRKSTFADGANEGLGSGSGHHHHHRKPRPLTQHQRALEQNRRERVQWVLAKRKRDMLKELKEKRENGNWILKVAGRLGEVEGIRPGGVENGGGITVFDSEDDDDEVESGGKVWGIGGLLGNLIGQNQGRKNKRNPAPQDESGSANDGVESDNSDKPGIETSVTTAEPEEEDYGEEAESWLKVIMRTRRLLDKWDGDKDVRTHQIHIGNIPEELNEAAVVEDDEDLQPVAYEKRPRVTRPRKSIPKKGRRSTAAAARAAARTDNGPDQDADGDMPGSSSPVRAEGRRAPVPRGAAGRRGRGKRQKLSLSRAAAAAAAAANAAAMAEMDEIDRSLLAERSEGEGEDGNEIDNDNDNDNEMDVDADADVEMVDDVEFDGAGDDDAEEAEDNSDARRSVEGDGDGEGDLDVDDSDIDMD